jgi:acyl carrier protein
MNRRSSLLAAGARAFIGCEPQPPAARELPAPTVAPAAHERQKANGIYPKPVSVEARVRRIVGEQLKLRPEKIALTSTWQQLGCDSLDTVELVMAFEEEFGIEIPDARAESFKTVGDAVTFLSQPRNKQ